MKTEATQSPSTPPAGDRAWFAALLLQRRDRLIPRFINAFAGLRDLSRGSRRRLQRRASVTLAGAALLLALGGGLVAPRPASAAAITVVDGLVVVLEDDQCSLREAIHNANDTITGQPYDDCAAGNPAGADTITLPAGGTFTLPDGAYYPGGYAIRYEKTGLPPITGRVTIEGNGATIERDVLDTDTFRLMAVDTTGDLTLNDVHLTGGHTTASNWSKGAGIYSSGNLAVTDSVVSGNTVAGSTGTHGGGIAVYGSYASPPTVTIRGTTISDNDAARTGGIFLSDANATILDSVISGNQADSAGGGITVYFGTDLLLENSTVDDNHTVYGSGGGLHIRTDKPGTIARSTISNNSSRSGGGIYVGDSDSVSITNSTISGNQAESGGGVQAAFSDVFLTHTTITDNDAVHYHPYYGTATGEGGGLRTIVGDVVLSATIISGNTSNGDGDEVWKASFSNTRIWTDDHNVFSHAGLSSAAAFTNFSPSWNTDINASSDGANVALGSILDTTLADNGGPTKTHNLVLGSPAIDTFDELTCQGQTDQRGFNRPVDIPGQGPFDWITCDSGAVEYGATAAADELLVTAAGGTTGDGLAYQKRDILRWDGAAWTKVFDGAAAGLPATADINAFDAGGGETLISFMQAGLNVPGLGKTPGHDIVLWDGASFTAFFDGSDVGLAQSAERIDALHRVADSSGLPGGGACAEYLLISTVGDARVPGILGVVRGGDVLGFCASSLGTTTAGTWNRVLQASAEGMPLGATVGVSLSSDGTKLYVLTKGAFNVDGAIGNRSMIFTFDLATRTFSGLVWRAVDNMLPHVVDSLDVNGALP